MPKATYRQDAGLHGETLACEELARRGYAILERRYRTRFGEIDIVATEAGMLVFVEVKARKTIDYGDAASTIPLWKRRRIAAMALDYLAWFDRLEAPCRFDVVAIDGLGTRRQRIEVIPDAFVVDGR